jgi:hypothetical protein
MSSSHCAFRFRIGAFAAPENGPEYMNPNVNPQGIAMDLIQKLFHIANQFFQIEFPIAVRFAL